MRTENEGAIEDGMEGREWEGSTCRWKKQAGNIVLAPRTLW